MHASALLHAARQRTCKFPQGESRIGFMDDRSQPQPELKAKIARLVEERGWNQEDFAQIAGLNRQTVRDIMSGNGGRTLRNSTIGRCARALNLGVNELRNLPLEQLLPRMHAQEPSPDEDRLRRLHDQATQPELRAWIERNPERAGQLTPAEVDELLSLQGVGGPLTRFGVEHYVEQLMRKRKLVERVHAIAGTEYLDLLEQLVGLLYEKVQPYGDRK
jgi:transcriptional regulator with XRE-family HTH domain